MTLYAIGDIQGCAQSFAELLGAIKFDRDEDHLWLVGDLVNRGPDSLAVLREVMHLGDSATTVLGNHDLHLLAAAAGARKPGNEDTFQQILAAPDAANILDWLRCRPLLHHDDDRNLLLVHAGLPPTWSVVEAVARAADIAAELQAPGWAKTLKNMYGDEPRSWSADLDDSDRSRYIINALTRMRYCDRRGALDFDHAGPPGTQSTALVPWFELPGARSDRYSCRIRPLGLSWAPASNRYHRVGQRLRMGQNAYSGAARAHWRAGRDCLHRSPASRLEELSARSLYTAMGARMCSCER